MSNNFWAHREQELFTQALKAQEKAADLQARVNELEHENWMLKAKLITAEGISEMRQIALDSLRGKQQ